MADTEVAGTVQVVLWALRRQQRHGKVMHEFAMLFTRTKQSEKYTYFTHRVERIRNILRLRL